MKLSSIVGYLNHLDSLEVESAVTLGDLTNISHVVQTSQVQIPGLTDELIAAQSLVELSLQQYNQKLNNIRQAVQSLIEQHEPEYFAASEGLYQNMQADTPDYIRNRILPIELDKKLLLQTRLQVHSNWKYPGLMIRPAHGLCLENLVALDPMYFADTHWELLAPVIEQYPPEYQRRIRRHVIEEYTDHPVFKNLPQQQFGFVYAFGYFNFKPLTIIRQYLREVFGLLRTGGTFLFSFNNCDHQNAVGLTEHHFCCYTPGRLVYEYALDLGYEIVQEGSVDGANTWVELKKPGIMTTIRGGQALAAIFKKPTLAKPVPIKIQNQPEVVDIPIKQLYNSLDLDKLCELSKILAIDISEATTKGMYNIKKVRRTIEAVLEQTQFSEDQLRKLFKRITQ